MQQIAAWLTIMRWCESWGPATALLLGSEAASKRWARLQRSSEAMHPPDGCQALHGPKAMLNTTAGHVVVKAASAQVLDMLSLPKASIALLATKPENAQVCPSS